MQIEIFQTFLQTLPSNILISPEEGLRCEKMQATRQDTKVEVEVEAGHPVLRINLILSGNQPQPCRKIQSLGKSSSQGEFTLQKG